MGLWSRYQERKYARIAEGLRKLEVRAAPMSPSQVVLALGAGIDAPARLVLTGSDPYAILTACSWAFSAVSATAGQISALTPVVQRKGEMSGDTDRDPWAESRWVDDPGHQLNQLLAQPHGPATAPPNHSWSQVLETIVYHLLMAPQGAILAVTRDGNRPISIWPLNPWGVTIQTDVYGIPTRYIYGAVQYAPADVIHITLTHPWSYTQSVPPLSAALRAAHIDMIAEQRQKALLENAVSPGLIVSVESAMGTTKEQEEEYQKFLRENYSLATQTGKPLVLGNNSKVLNPPPTPDQMQYVETRNAARDEILGVLGVPLPMLGLGLDKLSGANLQVLRRVWYYTRLAPLLSRIYDSINRQLVAKIAPDRRIWWDLSGSDVALSLMSERAEYAKQLTDLGYPTNLAARAAGLTMPWDDGLDLVNQKITVAGREDPNGDPNPEQS